MSLDAKQASQIRGIPGIFEILGISGTARR